VLGGLIVTGKSLEPARGAVELIGGGRALDELPPDPESLELDEPLEELELGRVVVPPSADSDAVQAIGIVTAPAALPA
jgi:hypothetical protein